MPRTDGVVTSYAGQPLFCHLDLAGSALVLSGAFDQRVPTAEPLLFPALAASAGAVLLAGQGHQSGALFLVLCLPGAEPHMIGDFGPAINANPVLIRATVAGWEVAVVRAADRVEHLLVTTIGGVHPAGFSTIPHTSQGITGWQGDAFTFGDPTTRSIAGRRISEARPVLEAAGWWIGQDNGHDHANRIVCVHDSGSAWVAYPSRVSQRPHAVVLPNGEWAITASDDHPITLVRQPGPHDATIGKPLTGPIDPPPPPHEPPEPDPMSTPAALIQTLVNAGREIDRRFPGLREQNLEAWAQKVGYFGHLADNRIGRKRNPSGRISPNAFGLKLAGGALTAADIVRENPPINEWRGQPEIHENVQGDQEWIQPEPVEVGEQPVPDPDPDPDPTDPLPTDPDQLNRVEVMLKRLGDHLGAW